MTAKQIVELKGDVIGMLMEKIEDIFINIQNSMNIKSGDISPLDAVRLEQKEIELAEMITNVLVSQKGDKEMDKINTTAMNTTTNTEKENKNMTNEIRTGKATNGEFAVSYQANGYGGVIPVIDGVAHPELLMGYVSESDREAGLKLIAEALKATGGDIRSAMMYMYNAAMTAGKDINADEAVDIDGEEVIIDYYGRKAYLGCEEIANLSDMTCDLPDVAIKAILTERCRNAIAEMESEYEEN